jgi:hypothetical protein
MDFYVSHWTVVQLEFCRDESSCHCARCGPHFHQTCIKLEQACILTSLDCSWQMPTIRQYRQVWEPNKLAKLLSASDRAFFMPLSDPRANCVWKRCFPLIKVLSESLFHTDTLQCAPWWTELQSHYYRSVTHTVQNCVINFQHASDSAKLCKGGYTQVYWHVWKVKLLNILVDPNM